MRNKNVKCMHSVYKYILPAKETTI